MSRRTKIVVGSLLMVAGVVLSHAALWLSTVPHNEYETFYRVTAVDAAGIAFCGYLIASYGVLVDEPVVSPRPNQQETP